MRKTTQLSRDRRTRFHRLIKESRRLFISEAEGSLWATDSYWALRIGDGSPVADLLADYNLPLEPMVCDVGPTIRRKQGVDAPSIAKVLTGGGDLITPYTINGVPLLAKGPGGCLEVWLHPDGTLATVRADYLDLIRCWVPSGDAVWRQRERIGPAGLTVDDTLQAVVMPVRSLFSDVRVPTEAPPPTPPKRRRKVA